MREYKRLVSYIYSYERGIKGKNIGFAKIESRNGVCKVNISVRVADELIKSGRDNMLEVYFFYRIDNMIKKILLEKMALNNGFGTAKLRMSSDNIGNHQIGIDDVAGMFLCYNSFWNENGSDDIIYASEWDDRPIRVEDFMEKDGNKILQEPIEIGYNESNIIESDESTSQEQSEYDNEDNTENNQYDHNRENGVTEVTASELKCNMEENCPEQEEDIADSELKSILNEKRSPRAGDYFRMLCGCYPKIKVNEIDGECIKITPHDISYLPKKYWSLCNNSFLLHGFYNYKYLLLCEKEVEGEKRYLICVPGLYHQKEQKVAGMFGFSEFEGNKDKDVMNFGYWCMYL